MANLIKLDFTPLDISGKNYLSWILDAENHLDAKGLGDTIKPENKVSLQVRAKALILLRHHLNEDLRTEYLTVKDPKILWSELKDRYDHQRMVILPKARYEWMHLRLQDFKAIAEYNSALFRITAHLKLCGEKITDDDLLEKMLSTFHASNVLLQQQYREKGFKKYSELISCLLVAEQNNELLLKNHGSHPTGSKPLPETNKVLFHARGRGRGRGGRGYGRGRGRRPERRPLNQKKSEEKGVNERPKILEELCFRCGMKGHWSRICRTPKHLADLYKASKGKGKMETHYANTSTATTSLDPSDFYSDSDMDWIDEALTRANDMSNMDIDI